jgi:hypothetical protein
MAGSVNELNSLSGLTREFLRSVVRRMSGKIAKRIKGTESKAPTNTEPSANSAPRKERRLCGEGRRLWNFEARLQNFLRTSGRLRPRMFTTVAPRRFLRVFRICYLFFWQRADVGHQLSNLIVALAVGDRRGKLRVRLLFY